MRWGAAAFVCLMASPVLAEEYACAFDLECLEGEECNATEFALALEVDETFEVMLLESGAMARLYASRIVTDAETVEGSFSVFLDRPDFPRTFGSEAGLSVAHMLIVEPDQSAEYNVIFAEDDFFIEYKGQCVEVAS